MAKHVKIEHWRNRRRLILNPIEQKDKEESYRKNLVHVLDLQRQLTQEINSYKVNFMKKLIDAEFYLKQALQSKGRLQDFCYLPSELALLEYNKLIDPKLNIVKERSVLMGKLRELNAIDIKTSNYLY